MILIPAIIGLSAAALLLIAGYLFGVKRASAAREQLRQQNFKQAETLQRLQEQLAQDPSEQDDGLRATIENILSPLVRREQLSFELAHLGTGAGAQGNLTLLLNQIAEKGNFVAVSLNDDNGWPLATSSNTQDVEGLSATAALMFLIAERMGRDDTPAPLALMLHNDANRVTLCRLFNVGDQRLSLTAISGDAQLAPTALNPALVQVEAALASRNPERA